jgi:hypothetical protein
MNAARPGRSHDGGRGTAQRRPSGIEARREGIRARKTANQAAATQLPEIKPKATASGFRRAASSSFSGASTSSARSRFFVDVSMRPVKRKTGFPSTTVLIDSMVGGLPELTTQINKHITSVCGSDQKHPRSNAIPIRSTKTILPGPTRKQVGRIQPV